MTATDTLHALLLQAQLGDRTAFDRLVAAVEPRLDACIAARMGEKLRGSLEAEDIKQETLLRAFSSLERFSWQGKESLARWLAGIVEHVLLYQGERAAVRGAERLAGDIMAEEISPSRGMRREERLQRLEGALAGLSPEHREVIVFARLERLPSAEIARRMKRSPAAIAQLLSRALKKLRERFGETESLGLPDRPLGGGGGGERPS